VQILIFSLIRSTRSQNNLRYHLVDPITKRTILTHPDSTLFHPDVHTLVQQPNFGTELVYDDIEANKHMMVVVLNRKRIVILKNQIEIKTRLKNTIENRIENTLEAITKTLLIFYYDIPCIL